MTTLYPTQTAYSTPFDNETNGFASDDVQNAIEESTSLGGVSRYAVVYASSGNTSIKWLELFPGVTSDQSPFVIAEVSELVSLSISAKLSTTCGVEVYVNAVSIASLSLTAQKTNFVSGLSYTLNPGDEVGVQITSGSARDPVFAVNIKVSA